MASSWRPLPREELDMSPCGETEVQVSQSSLQEEAVPDQPAPAAPLTGCKHINESSSHHVGQGRTFQLSPTQRVSPKH